MTDDTPLCITLTRGTWLEVERGLLTAWLSTKDDTLLRMIASIGRARMSQESEAKFKPELAQRRAAYRQRKGVR